MVLIMGYISSMNKFTLILLLFLINSFILSASDSVIYNLSDENRTILFNSGEISRYFFKKDKPEYLFATSFENDLLNEITKLNVTIGVESLFFIKYSDDITLLSIYNTLLSVKTMKGIEYYSQSRKKMRTLFTESHGIVNLDNLKQLDDPVVETIPYVLNRFLLQTDKTFGENLYEATYRSDGNAIWVNMVNKTKMKYKFIPMLKPDKMSVNLLILPVEDGLLFYGVTAAETTSFLGLEKAKKESFYNRIKAMFNWFSDQLAVDIQ